MGQKVKCCKLIGLKLNNDKVHEKNNPFNIAVKTKKHLQTWIFMDKQNSWMIKGNFDMIVKLI